MIRRRTSDVRGSSQRGGVLQVSIARPVGTTVAACGQRGSKASCVRAEMVMESTTYRRRVRNHLVLLREILVELEDRRDVAAPAQTRARMSTRSRYDMRIADADAP